MLTYIINAFNEVVIKMNISIDGRGINWYKGTGIGTYTKKNINKYDSRNSRRFIQYILVRG